jgi:hypothetical protein
MSVAESVRRRGFRKWYERQLIDGHLALVTCFLCMLLVAGLLEEFSFKLGAGEATLMLAVAFGSVVLGSFAWQRYRGVLERAERFGEQSTCAECGTYARFDVVEAGGEGDGWMKVRCRKCGACWRME